MNYIIINRVKINFIEGLELDTQVTFSAPMDPEISQGRPCRNGSGSTIPQRGRGWGEGGRKGGLGRILGEDLLNRSHSETEKFKQG